MTVSTLDATVVIATYNRATLLGETIDSLKRMRVSPRLRWEVIIIDNNSTDDTRAVVERHVPGFPVPLRYLFEANQGRSSALNTGIAAAAGTVLAFTDDDVRVADGWLDVACDALLRRDDSIAYAGGPVRPIWEVPPPVWLDLSRSDLWGTIAIEDYGPKSFVFEEARRVPLGANMAVARTLFDRVGGFRPDLGRSGGRLILGQEVPEFLLRTRAAGFRGLYLPAMAVDHHIPARRLTPAYFRKWWFGKGVSRSALDRMQTITDMGLDLTRTPHVLRVPRYMYGSVVRDIIGWLRDSLRTRPADAFRHKMMLAYFAGYFYARQVERRKNKPGTTAPEKRNTTVAA